MTAKNQLLKEQAQRLFDYSDGQLFWRHGGSGQRPGRDAIRVKTERRGCKRAVIIGGQKFSPRYVIWNWHHGVSALPVVCSDGDPANLRIENLKQMEARPPEFISPLPALSRMTCPCCDQKVATPSLRVILEHLKLPAQQEAIVQALWAGKGRPVMNATIFSWMYADDENGGPNEGHMYAALKVAMSKLRARLRGTGIGIQHAGYRAGYRLVLGESAEAEEAPVRLVAGE